MAALTDVRPAICEAITAHFGANPTHAFAAAVGERFGFGKAVQGWGYPRAVFFFVDASPEDTFTERNDDVLIQFSVWATTATAALRLSSLAYGMFEGQTMTAAGIIPFRLRRESPVPLMEESDTTTTLWQSGITLAGLVQTL